MYGLIDEIQELRREVEELKSVLRNTRERNNQLLEEKRSLERELEDRQREYRILSTELELTQEVCGSLAYSVSEMRANDFHQGRIQRADAALKAYDTVKD